MSDKKSIREFIDNEIHLLWNQYHNYDIDCKLSVKKEFFTNDIIDGYEILKEIVPEEVVQETTGETENTNLELVTEEQFEVAEGTNPPDQIEIVSEVLVTNEPLPDPVVVEIEEETVTESIVQESVVEEELNNKYIYHVLNDDEDYIIVRSFNNSSLLKAITENKVNYPEGVEINSIEDLFLSGIWHAGGLTYFFDDGIEYEWFCRCEY